MELKVFNEKVAYRLAIIAVVYGIVTYFIGFNTIAMCVAGVVAALTLILTSCQSYYSCRAYDHNPSIFWVDYGIPFAAVAVIAIVAHGCKASFMTIDLLSGIVAFGVLCIVPILGAFLGQMARVFTFKETTW